MRIFLSGPMGSGKSTIGGYLGQRAGLPVFDLDTLVERRVGCAVTEFFAREGEGRFRAVEAEVLSDIVAREVGMVLSLGGGTVTNRELRHRLLQQGLLVTLDASPSVLAARVGVGEGRPLLAGADPELRLAAIRRERADAYAECHGRVDTGTLSPEAAADAVLSLARESAVVVPLGARTYLARAQAGVRSRLVECVHGASSVILVTDSTVDPLHASALAEAVGVSGVRVTKVVLEPGEQAKHIASVQRIWEAALAAGIDRRAMVVGVGGGVVGDLSGFAAASLLRGIRVGHVPTTLLSMVDSSIGGKTGFDTREGKNLIGAFHQPSFVLADVEVLSTLPRAERVAGLAEVAKSAWIAGESAVAQLEADAEALVAGDVPATERAIRMSCLMKARVVTEDEREGGLRAILNLGHTVGHAIEAFKGYAAFRHGEGVALGMVAACRVARATGQQTEAQGARMVRLLRQLGLPTELDVHLEPGVADFLSKDKKMDGAVLKFIVPAGPGDVRVVPMPVTDIVRHVWPATT